MPKRDFQTGTQDLMRMKLGAGPYEWLQMSYDPELDTLVSNPVVVITQTFQIDETTGFKYLANANALHLPWRIYVDHLLEMQLRATMMMRNLDGPAYPADEEYTITITGTPTGGTFTITFLEQTTAAIAYNTDAATVQSALEALSNIDPGDVAVTGGPGPGTPYTVTMQGQYAGMNLPNHSIDAAHAFTGGTTPDIDAVNSTTAGGAFAWVEMRSADVLGQESSDYLDWVVDLVPAADEFTLQSTGWGGYQDWIDQWETFYGGPPTPFPLADYLRVAPQMWTLTGGHRAQVLGFTCEMRLIAA